MPVIVVEKATLVAQLRHWFTDPLGIPVIPLRGYHSESQERQIRDLCRDRAHAAIYLGDHDPSGYDIERNARRRFGDAFVDWTSVAINVEVIDRYGLPENPGKETDSRAKQFIERFGCLTQVELEALDPGDLRELIRHAIGRYWDVSRYQASLVREAADQAALQAIAEAQT